jgi:hypothetical protein
MRLHYIVTGIFALSIFGCGGAAPSTNALAGLNNVTDLSTCQGSANAGDTVIGAWNAVYADTAGDKAIYNMNFQANTLTLTVTCQFATGLTISAPITAGIEMLANNQISIPTAEEYNAPPQVDSTGVSRSCGAVIQQGTMSYSFVGPCLQLQQTGPAQMELIRNL